MSYFFVDMSVKMALLGNSKDSLCMSGTDHVRLVKHNIASGQPERCGIHYGHQCTRVGSAKLTSLNI